MLQPSAPRSPKQEAFDAAWEALESKAKEGKWDGRTLEHARWFLNFFFEGGTLAVEQLPSANVVISVVAIFVKVVRSRAPLGLPGEKHLDVVQAIERFRKATADKAAKALAAGQTKAA